MSNIKLENMRKVYDDAKGTDVAVSGFSLSIDDGEFVVLVGPSGCGKSTTLQMIAGLETVTNGQIYIDNREVQMLGCKRERCRNGLSKVRALPHNECA